MRTVLPKSTKESRQKAVEASNIARRNRADLKNSLKSGSITLEQALSDSRAERIYVSDLIRSMPGVGVKTMARVMVEVGIHRNRRVKGLGVNQRAELLEWAAARSREA